MREDAHIMCKKVSVIRTVIEPSVADDTSTDAATQTTYVTREDASVQIGVDAIEDMST